MNIYKERPQDWWIGLTATCGQCGFYTRVEQHYRVSVTEENGQVTDANLDCANCGHTINLKAEPDIQQLVLP